MGRKWSILADMAPGQLHDGTEPSTGPSTEPDPDEPATTSDEAGEAGEAGETPGADWRRRLLDSTPVTLAQAAHPRQAAATAVVLAAAALASGRPLGEAAIVLATVLVGQSILGWHNDLVDRERDAAHDTAGKPIAQGRLDPGTVWYALIIAVLLVIPLSISVGVTAGTYYLASLVVGLLGNVALRRGRLSFVPWMVSFALLPAYLSYGGYGGNAEGDPPQVAMVLGAALLGVGVHFLRAIWGLVEDDLDGWTYYPLVLGRRLGATRLLTWSTGYTAAVVGLLIVLGSTIGLRQ